MRRCKAKDCRNELPPVAKCYTPLHKSGFCCPECFTKHWAWKKIEKAKKEARKDLREYNKKDINKRKAKAQEAFNKYIRLRDRGLPCISCGREDDGEHQRHASHYIPVGRSSALRYNELNVWASCAQCNSCKSGNITEYRINLVKKIGLESVEFLENHERKYRWSLDEVNNIEAKYKQKIKELESDIDFLL